MAKNGHHLMAAAKLLILSLKEMNIPEDGPEVTAEFNALKHSAVDNRETFLLESMEHISRLYGTIIESRIRRLLANMELLDVIAVIEQTQKGQPN